MPDRAISQSNCDPELLPFPSQREVPFPVVQVSGQFFITGTNVLSQYLNLWEGGVRFLPVLKYGYPLTLRPEDPMNFGTVKLSQESINNVEHILQKREASN